MPEGLRHIAAQQPVHRPQPQSLGGRIEQKEGGAPRAGQVRRGLQKLCESIGQVIVARCGQPQFQERRHVVIAMFELRRGLRQPAQKSRQNLGQQRRFDEIDG